MATTEYNEDKRNKERNKQIVELRRDSEWTFQKIGDYLGVSKQRAQFIYNREIDLEVGSKTTMMMNTLPFPREDISLEQIEAHKQAIYQSMFCNKLGKQ